MENLRQPKIHRIFRAWLEDWEKELLEVNDCVAEARLLEKYRDLMFLDPDTNKTFKVWGGNLEYHRGSRKRGITKGWGLVCIDENGEEEGWLLNKDVIELIGLHSQEGGVQIIRNGDELVQNTGGDENTGREDWSGELQCAGV